MSPRPNAKPHGQLRQSQVVTTFGPGSLLDLPNYSVIVGGLDHWSKGGEEIHEPRLVEKVKRLLDIADIKFFTPPPAIEDPTGPRTGLTVWQFPQWYVTQDVKGGATLFTRSRLLVHRRSLSQGRYIDQDGVRRSVVPIRFVRACRRGHIEDIDWYAFVHRGQTTCHRLLWIDERGTSGDLSEVWIRCECGAERQMIDAARLETKALGNCDGSRPWLGPLTRETCGEPNRLLVRTASNAYFPQVMSVISLPDRSEDLTRAINQVWTLYLANIQTLEQLQMFRGVVPQLKDVLQGFTDEEIFAEILARRGEGGGSAMSKTIKQAEMETLSDNRDELGEDKPDGNFYAKSLPRSEWDEPWMASIERVVLVHRLREVSAQVGFTRFEPAAPDVDGELEIGVRRAAIARETSWLPAAENRGEGVFIKFSSDAIKNWQNQDTVKQRGKQLLAGFKCWHADHETTKRVFPGLPYIMLHSLSHLLITSVSLECGYPASSIRERVYAGEAGYGILLYTGSPDAEGTLGGLVEIGHHIAHHIKCALDLGGLCSSDPVCAQHDPQNPHERRFLLGAACHGCLLIAETSCEQHNDFLDRALVVPTLDNLGAEFFHVSNGC